MTTRRQRIDRAIAKYGADVVLTYKPTENDAVDEDWPDPSDAVTTPADPATRTLKALMVPEQDTEGRNVSEAGNWPTERVQAFFSADIDLNNVASVRWQGGDYKVMSQDAYELSGQILAQATVLIRLSTTTVAPHA